MVKFVCSKKFPLHGGRTAKLRQKTFFLRFSLDRRPRDPRFDHRPLGIAILRFDCSHATGDIFSRMVKRSVVGLPPGVESFYDLSEVMNDVIESNKEQLFAVRQK